MTITCSQCGAVKGTVNHWWFGWTERAGQRLCIIPWQADEGLIHEPTVQRLCGQNCVQRFVQQYLDQKVAA